MTAAFRGEFRTLVYIERGLARYPPGVEGANVLPDAELLRHELRTPLNQIVGYGEMLLDDSIQADGGELGERIREILGLARELTGSVARAAPGETPAIENEAGRLERLIDAPTSQEVEWIAPVAGQMRRAAADLVRLADGDRPTGEEWQCTFRAANAPVAPKATLLVVDDNDRNRDVLERQLDREGYAVLAACNGREALRALRERACDLVLLDVLMPQLGGFETLEAIKSDPQLRELPVIMISASDEYQSVIRCIESGAEDYLPKPFDPILLKARIKASLEKKALRDEQQRKAEELERAYRDLQKFQDQLVTQEKLASLGALAAGIAHEIKNPLNFISNFSALSVELIGELREYLGDVASDDTLAVLADLEQNAQRIREHSGRADRIVRGMLMHARKQSGARETTDLNSLVLESAQLAYHGFRSRDMNFNSALETEFDTSIGRISVFPQDLNRAFLNIAINAFESVHEKRLKAGDEYRPAVRFSTHVVGDTVEVRIRDNGMGIAAEALGRMFEPFFTTKPAGSGTGLGLSISREIVVKEHHGELQAESREGEFAEFIMRLPRDGA